MTVSQIALLRSLAVAGVARGCAEQQRGQIADPVGLTRVLVKPTLVLAAERLRDDRNVRQASLKLNRDPLGSPEQTRTLPTTGARVDVDFGL